MNAHPVNPLSVAWQTSLALLLLFAAGVEPARGAAANAVWSGSNSSAWQVNANWSPTNACPTNTGDKATFNSAGNNQTNVTITGTIVLGGNAKQGLVFDTPNAAAYTVSGGTISAPSSNGNADYLVVVNPSVVNSQTINAALTPSVYINVNSGQDGGYFENYSPVANLTLGGGISHTAASTGSTNTISLLGQGSIAVTGPIADGPSNKTCLCTTRIGTTTLSGVNTFSGIYYDSGSLNYNLMMGRDSTVVLDYSGMAVSDGTNTTTVLPDGTSVNLGVVGSLGGALVLRGVPDPSVVTAQRLGKLRMTRGQTTFVLDRNGGAGVQLTLSPIWAVASGSSAPAVAFDLSSGGTARLSAPNFVSGTAVFTNNNGTINGNTYAATTVKHTDGKTYFATLTADGAILPLTDMIPLPIKGTSGSTNYLLTGSWTAALANPSVNTLRIEPSAAEQSINLSNRTFMLTSQAVILDGPYDYAITNGAFGSPIAFIVAGTGKLTVGAKLVSTSLSSMSKFGPGLLELTGANSLQGGDLFAFGGVLRVNAETALTSSNLVIGTAVLEVGYDFTRTVGAGAGQVKLEANGGFSAYGGNHTINLGGAGATLKFGGSGFTASRDGKLMLSSSTSDSTVDFQNPLNLNADHQTVEVADGAALVDAMLSGSLTNGGLIKTGSGTLALTSNNVHGLGTVAGAGTLLANNAAGSATGTGAVTICSGATLGGTGTIVAGVSNLVWIGGTLAPGAGTATNVAGATLSVDLAALGCKLQLAGGATLSCKLGPSGTADQVRILNSSAGKVAFSNNVVKVANAGGLAPGSYTLMSFFADNGTTLTDSGKPTSGLVLGTTPANLTSRIDYTQTGKIVLRVAPQGLSILFR